MALNSLTDCTELVIVEFYIVFKFCQYRVAAVLKASVPCLVETKSNRIIFHFHTKVEASLNRFPKRNKWKKTAMFAMSVIWSENTLSSICNTGCPRKNDTYSVVSSDKNRWLINLQCSLIVNLNVDTSFTGIAALRAKFLILKVQICLVGRTRNLAP